MKDNVDNIRDQFVEFQLLIRVIVFLLMVIGFLQSAFLLLLLASIISGSNYGFNNDSFWESPYFPILGNRKVSHPNNQKYNKILYVSHQVWVHILCAIVGAIALYLLSLRFNSYIYWNYHLSWIDLVLLIVALLGYTGLLPRTLWFFASRGDIKKL